MKEVTLKFESEEDYKTFLEILESGDNVHFNKANSTAFIKKVEE